MADNTTTEVDISLEEAEECLAALDPDEKRFEFQTADDNRNPEEKNPKLSGGRYGALRGEARWLIGMNDKLAGVYVALNRTDGKGRKKENITEIRAMFADLDGQPLDKVRECPLKPHIINETSPGRYHVLWRVTGFPLEQWEDVQRGIAARLDSDSGVATLERCIRLPGFYNCKDVDDLFRVRIEEINDHPPFTAEQIDVDPVGGTTGTGFLIGNATAPTS
jgi:RepB DNA-primase from phage plasmid